MATAVNTVPEDSIHLSPLNVGYRCQHSPLTSTLQAFPLNAKKQPDLEHHQQIEDDAFCACAHLKNACLDLHTRQEEVPQACLHPLVLSDGHQPTGREC